MIALEPGKLGRLPIHIPMAEVAAFCERFQVTEFALFGSVLRDDFRPDSDIDVLVTFDPAASPTLLTLARMEIQLEGLFGRRVHLMESGGLAQCDNPCIRESVTQAARVIYAR